MAYTVLCPGGKRLDPIIIVTFVQRVFASSPPLSFINIVDLSHVDLPANSFPARKISDMNEGIVE